MFGVFWLLPFAPFAAAAPSPSASSSSASPGSPSAASAPSAASPSAPSPPPCVPAAMNRSAVTPALKRSCAAMFSPSFSIAVTRWTVPTTLSLPASSSASCITLRVRDVIGRSPRCKTPGALPEIIVRSDSARSSTDRPSFSSRRHAWHVGIARSARKMCSEPIWSWPSCRAQLADALSASTAFFEYFALTGTSPPPVRSAPRPRTACSSRPRARRPPRRASRPSSPPHRPRPHPPRPPCPVRRRAPREAR